MNTTITTICLTGTLLGWLPKQRPLAWQRTTLSAQMFVCKKVKKEKKEGGVVTTQAVTRNHFSFLQADNNAKPMQVVLVHRENQLFHGKNINVDGVMICFVVRVVIF